MQKVILFISIFCLLAPSLFSQTQYFVSTSGSNSNSGTSIVEAWLTIQHAMDNAIPNSEVNILVGIYNEKVEVNVSGTAGNNITFQNFNSDVVTISGSGIANPDAIIGIFDQSYITIEGLNIANNEQLDAQGIIVEGNCQDIKIINNNISNINFSSDPNAPVDENTNSQPLIVYGNNGSIPISNLNISDNTVHNCRTGFSEGLAVNGNVDGFEVINNTVYDITNIGIDLIGHEGTASSNDQARNGTVKSNTIYNCQSPYATAAGIYVDGGKDIVIENNTIYQNQWGIEIGCENVGKTASGIKVRNNMIYGNDDAALAIGGFDFPSGSGKVVDCLITNNSCYNNDVNAGGVGGVTGELNITYTENCILENNIFYTDNSANLIIYVENVSSINLGLDYNQFFINGNAEFDYQGSTYTSFANYQTGASQDANSIFSNPQFSNISIPDLHLTESSPARDVGNPSFITGAGETDIDGENRVQNNQVDMGADEYNTSLSVEYVAPFQAIAFSNYIELVWSTTFEINNDQYIIQRSTDTYEWKDIMTIKGNKNATTNIHYRALDTSPIRGLAYYRLKQVDLDGRFEYSNIASVKWEMTLSKIAIFPNPSSEMVFFEIYNPQNESLTVQIFDNDGQLKLEYPYIKMQKLELNVSDWEIGSYFIKITDSFGLVNQSQFVVY